MEDAPPRRGRRSHRLASVLGLGWSVWGEASRGFLERPWSSRRRFRAPGAQARRGLMGSGTAAVANHPRRVLAEADPPYPVRGPRVLAARSFAPKPRSRSG